MSQVRVEAVPNDQHTRDLISASGLDDTLFVEAGAGTGKTTQLVGRIVNTVLTNDVALSDIAAITFTEAAATELQARIRVAFERRIADPASSDRERELSRQAVADADMAAISTVHGFASRILGEFSVAAGLPPRVSVLDEVSSQLAHERRWERFVDRLHEQPQFEELLYRAALIGIPLSPQYNGQSSFKDVAANFGQNWDRLDEIDVDTFPVLGPVDFAAFDRAVGELEAVVARCTDPADKLLVHIQRSCLPSMQHLQGLADPHQKLRQMCTGVAWGRGQGGKKGAWGCNDIAEIKDLITAVTEAAGAVVSAASAAVVDQLMRLTAGEVLQAARARQMDGGLEFHDLLVLARRALRRNPEVRRTLHDRYRHILLDEFQDTDPIQIELASLIASTPAEAQPERWQDHPVPPGRLFFVGDPKQSIYRFRRADISLFLAAREAFGTAGLGAVDLRTNFRTVRPIIDWVNAVFSEAMPEEIDGAQPRYEALDAWREGDSGADHRPVVFGGPHPDPKVKAGTLREGEAADVAAIVADIIDRPDAWPVFDDRSSQWRPARLSDVTVLIPTRTSLPFLRTALDGADIPYRLATGTLVYDTQEVRDALSALRAVADPNDTLSLVAALRSPLYGCSDVDLFDYHRAQRRWDLRAAVPESLTDDHPVVAALAHLRSLWEQRWWLTPANLLERVLRERRAMLLAFGDSRPAEVWRRLRFLVDQARSFEESVGGDLRSFLDWAALQSADGARVHEPLLPETDLDAIQILTVHGSKGLEFPITVLSGMTTQAAGARPGVSVLWNDVGPPEIKLRTGVSTPEHQPRADLEAEMDEHEKLRLLYVAATRARDHLIVSGHHKAPAKSPGATYATRLSTFASDHPELGRHVEIDATTVPASTSTHTPTPAPPPDRSTVFAERDAWIGARRALLDPFDRPSTMSATAIARTVDASIADVDDDAGSGGLSGTPDDSDARPIIRRKGRAGSSIGRAVHATLEHVDFSDPGNVAELVARQCDLEGIADQADTVLALVESALRSDAVGLAALHPSHRELYVAAPLGPVTIEGYVDLLVETPDGLVVVDYKTDTVTSPAQVASKVAAYELQAAAYAVALEESTGLTVIECRLVFCNVAGAIEVTVDDLSASKQRVRDAVAGPSAAVDPLRNEPPPGLVSDPEELAPDVGQVQASLPFD